MVKIILCALYVALSVSGLVLFKYATINSEGSVCIPVLEIVISKFSLCGLFCYGLSFLMYISVISKFDLAYIIPILGGVNNILIVIASIAILNEALTATSIIGAVVIIIGIVIMNIKI